MHTTALLISILAALFFAVDCATPQPTKVGLGANVDWFCGPCDYYGAAVFVNAFKQSRKIGNFNKGWDTTNITYNSIGMPTNSKSFSSLVFWALARPNTETEGVWTVRLSGANATAAPGFGSGECTATYNRKYDPSTKTFTANFNCTAKALSLSMDFQVYDNSVITNIEVIRPGYPIDNYPMFTSSYLNFRKGFNALRFMDWARTNGNSNSAWVDRTAPEDLSWTEGGVPWEAVIELANQVGSNVWVNVPSNATDDYIVNMAKLFKQKLASHLIVYLEYANEPWNSQFDVTQDSYRISKLLVASGNYSFLNYDNTTNTYYVAYRWIVWRGLVCSNLWRSVYGDAAMGTMIRPVLNGQVVNSVWLSQSLPMVDTVFGPPSYFFWAVAIAPYFNLMNGSLDHTVDQAWEQIDLGAVNAARSITPNMAVAKRYGLELVCYEGGADVQTGNATSRKALNTDPRISGTIKKHLEIFVSAGVRLYMYYFVGVNEFDGNDDWGTVDSISNTSEPKHQALLDILADGRADYEHPYAAPVGTSLLTPNWSFVPQSEMGWPKSWDLHRWNTWSPLVGEAGVNGAIYDLEFEIKTDTGISFALLINGKLANNISVPATPVRANITVATIRTFPRANSLFFNITSFGSSTGDIYFVRVNRKSDAPTYTYLPMSYPPSAGGSTGGGATGTTNGVTNGGGAPTGGSTGGASATAGSGSSTTTASPNAGSALSAAFSVAWMLTIAFFFL